ncbi:unnamed protein product [Clonostachys rosea f. rosea IK726]|uniref:Uncharacterized protein n=1 Tax=Clonostachys rosea f. rosea IK726 TaxID=1349383 RepID=A0ACA9TDS5_BIOOC|nr:unnamed protein product [Clonostachys rosea f. rosea IK726]
MEKVTNVPTAAEDDFPSLVNFAKEHGIGLVVAGPDDAVVNGIAGHFEDAAIPCFAPSKKAAEVEGSKAYSKAFMKKYGIPTASYKAFDNYDDAKAYLESVNCSQIVLKVDGLAAGKGVVLPSNEAEAHEALRSMMVDSKFGSSGQSVVIEELLDGDEISILTFADGTAAFKSLPPGQDHNRIFEGNKGPNTGGMGVYAPLAFVTPDDLRIIDQDIIKPTLDGLRAEGIAPAMRISHILTLLTGRLFAGMLFTGVMMTSKGPKVLEYNARFGDPETQTMMMLLAPECDLAAVLMACSTKKLQTVADKISVRPGFACNVVVAAGGYPESYRKGDGISLGECPLGLFTSGFLNRSALTLYLGIEIFHAGTERTANGELVTSGGRVLSVAAHGATLEQAVSLAYEGVKHIQFKDKTYRKDIAAR